MPAKQFNLRLRDGLDRQVRVRAAQLGVDPRDVVEDALVASGFQRDASGPPAGQLPLPTSSAALATPLATAGDTSQTEAPLRAENGSREPEVADQRGDEARTPRRNRRKDRTDKAGEAGTSGRDGGGALQSGTDPAVSRPTGCPECGADYTDEDGIAVCNDCGNRFEVING